jgi:hypothetical protein
MAAENNQLFGSHRQAEDGFEDNKPSRPTVERLESRQRTEQPPVLYRVDDGDLSGHKQKKPVWQLQRAEALQDSPHRLFAAALMAGLSQALCWAKL